MTDVEQEMAESFYGYGHWGAPYWFVGPEQGQGKKEDDDLGPRTRAWETLKKPDIADLKEFHDLLRPGMWTEEGAPLQSTWRKLMLILLTSLGANTYKENLRKYQRLELGRKNGQTCLIELSGLPANNSRTERDREAFLHGRIERIAREFRTRKPRILVMYGKGQYKRFRDIIGQLPELDNVTTVGSTAVLFTKHTNARKTPDEYWLSLGRKLSSYVEHDQN